MPQNIDLRGRIAGQSAMAAVVEAQSRRAPRGFVARLCGVSPLTKESRAQYRGAVGELLVGSILDRLGHSWDVLHGVPLGETSLDHFAVGRAGIFAVTVVNCQGDDVAVNGDELVVARAVSTAIVASRTAARAVARALTAALGHEVEVIPVLVMVEPVKVSLLAAPADVHVLTSTQLEQWLASAPEVFTGDEVATISTAAEAGTTWPHPQQAAQKSRNLTRAFVRIHHDVRAASLRSFLWIVVALIVTFLSVWVLVSVLARLVMSS
ncbi:MULTISPECIES: nuclease-related domain-containing protein [unclassified Salinibacterium]|uniref:nuclease-related domain-containing protein n=1 Tax=unclassified Salinibacterium TaxID=2632331 RepID=UPI0027DA744B|nr:MULTISPECIES: nuclease-related domain-containing protein [unclassified Salinibacterium]